MAHHHRRGDPAALPVVDPLLKPVVFADAEEASERCIAAGGGDQGSGFGGVHARNYKHGVYGKSNTACTTCLNELFNILQVPDTQRKRPIDVVLELADAKGWDQAGLARAMGVSSASVTNWKTRGLPADQLEIAADALDCSVDRILSRMKFVNPSLPLFAARSAEAAAFAAEWDKLTNPIIRHQIRAMVEAAVGQEFQDDRPTKKKKAAKPSEGRRSS